METTTKPRTERCRDWERQRRNKFNDAIAKLGVIVKSILKANDPQTYNQDDTQYPKIEIIQKAILCLNNCTQEKTQLKAEILALQVKLDADATQKKDKQDASTQVYIGINKKNKNGKYVKLVMMQKSKRKALKEKSIVTNVGPTKEPKILPKTNILNEKGTQNTFVVLPAHPYIFPQRPILIPSGPPAIVLVDPQTLNKSTIPIVNRNCGDITKTTMVNILPISAYSRPLSAMKAKPNDKLKAETTKKLNRKPSEKVIKKKKKDDQHNSTKINLKVKTNSNPNIEDPSGKSETTTLPTQLTDSVQVLDIKVCTTKSAVVDSVIVNPEANLDIKRSTDIILNASSNKISTDKPKCTEIVVPTKPALVASTTKHFDNPENVNVKNKNQKTESLDKVSLVKEVSIENKTIEKKMPHILESTLSENAVDGGNARLELAEEFLAASPTAAFLMSFPLVSGNRADSPNEDAQNPVQPSKDNLQRKLETTTQFSPYFSKNDANDPKTKSIDKISLTSANISKQNAEQKNITNTVPESKVSNIINVSTSVPIFSKTNENPFLNLPMPSLITTNCTLSDAAFGSEFDCNINKSVASQSNSYVSNSNIFYKSDPFGTVKNSIYSTSNITSSHDFNGLGLYPCAMEKYTTKNKTDFTNVDENIMKLGSSRLTYDIDLGWSHKSFDFVNCATTSSTLSKESVVNTTTATYNPFNPEFHPLVSTTNKKDNVSHKPTSFSETITSIYSQPTNLWMEDSTFYSSNNSSKPSSKHQHYSHSQHVQVNTNVKNNNLKHYEKNESISENRIKSAVVGTELQINEKYTKKSPTKSHINWMTSEMRPIQSNCNLGLSEIKDTNKTLYNHLDHKSAYNNLDSMNKKQENTDATYFPITMHNYPIQSTQTAQEEFQVWPSTRPLGTTEISIEPPPINLPTLVGDLALGPHDKKKASEVIHRIPPQNDVQNCGNFFSVTQLMNRSTDNVPNRYQSLNNEATQSISTKQSMSHFSTEITRKAVTSHIDSNLSQPSAYTFNESKLIHTYENMNTNFLHSKTKANKSEKSAKSHKNNYSAESLIRGGNFTQKVQDSARFMMPSQKYNDYNIAQDNSVAQVSHFPPIIDYSENAFTGQQYSGTTLYNTTTNTISNSFYSNFMPSSSNLMSSNYASAPFTSEFIDYNQTAECNYSNHKYEELKIRNSSTTFQGDKGPSNYKNLRRESTVKHKLECSKKETSKKYQSKKPKLNTEMEEWNDPHLLWQNKVPNKRHSNMSEDVPFPNYMSNQMPTQYQPDFFNGHLMPPNVQGVSHNMDRSLSGFPGTSRANFNLSTIFPEITMKVQ